MVDSHNLITIEPGKCGGKPCIRGARMTENHVLEYLASGMSHTEFPDPAEEDICARLAFAADRERKPAALPAGNCSLIKIARPICLVSLPVCFPASCL